VSLFGILPEDIKIALGSEFNETTWNEIRNDKRVHDYLKDTEIQQEPQIVTRQRLASDKHALEQEEPGQDNTMIAPEDASLINDLEETELLEHLKTLHEKTLLTAPDISLSDINRIFREKVNDDFATDVADELPELDEQENTDEKEVTTNRNNSAEVHPDNILPEGTKRHVRFNLPVAR
jgi:alpha-glucosidase (family GH31 glycosyl hydrolase)